MEAKTLDLLSQYMQASLDTGDGGIGAQASAAALIVHVAVVGEATGMSRADQFAAMHQLLDELYDEPNVTALVAGLATRIRQARERKAKVQS